MCINGKIICTVCKKEDYIPFMCEKMTIVRSNNESECMRSLCLLTAHINCVEEKRLTNSTYRPSSEIGAILRGWDKSENNYTMVWTETSMFWSPYTTTYMDQYDEMCKVAGIIMEFCSC